MEPTNCICEDWIEIDDSELSKSFGYNGAYARCGKFDCAAMCNGWLEDCPLKNGEQK